MTSLTNTTQTRQKTITTISPDIGLNGDRSRIELREDCVEIRGESGTLTSEQLEWRFEERKSERKKLNSEQSEMGFVDRGREKEMLNSEQLKWRFAKRKRKVVNSD